MFKTIIRDMRKFYIDDFNVKTSYIKRKRYRDESFYMTSIRSYIATTDNLQNKVTPELEIYLGALIYPKHLVSGDKPE